MILGEKELIKLFPEFKDLVQPAGIDMRLDEVFEQASPASLLDDEKKLPKLKRLKPPIYTLKPKKAYLVTVDKKIKVPRGYGMIYLPRSTLLRSFISVHTAFGDPGFQGKLKFLVYNYGNFEYKIKKGERIIQAIVFKVKGSGEYTGSYQEPL
ncbi:dUTP diphosphatase [Methanothermobacter sp. MT-2]|nr:dUTP diphosphatase [Methanothermobacter sp. MT-2]